MADSTPLRKLVRARCDAKAWTFEDVARNADMSVAGLRKLCDGKVEEPRSPTVNRLARVLGISAAALRAAVEASRRG